MSTLKSLRKSVLLAAGALALATSSLAAGPKDGIYVFTPPSAAADAQEFLTFHTNNAGQVVAGIYRSRAATVPNRSMGLTVYGMEGGNFNADGVPQEAGTLMGHMYRWASWDSLSGKIANNVATLTGTANHVGCKATVTVYLDGVQPTMTVSSTVSESAEEQLSAGILEAHPATPAGRTEANLRITKAKEVLAEECAKLTYNYTTNLTKWF